MSNPLTGSRTAPRREARMSMSFVGKKAEEKVKADGTPDETTPLVLKNPDASQPRPTRADSARISRTSTKLVFAAKDDEIQPGITQKDSTHYRPSAVFGLRAFQKLRREAAEEAEKREPPPMDERMLLLDDSGQESPTREEKPAGAAGPKTGKEGVLDKLGRRLSRRKKDTEIVVPKRVPPSADRDDPLVELDLPMVAAPPKKTGITNDTAKSIFNPVWSGLQPARAIPSDLMSEMAGLWPVSAIILVCQMADSHWAAVDYDMARKDYATSQKKFVDAVKLLHKLQLQLVNLYRRKSARPPAQPPRDAGAQAQADWKTEMQRWQETQEAALGQIAALEEEVSMTKLALAFVTTAMAGFETQFCRPEELAATQKYRQGHLDVLTALQALTDGVASDVSLDEQKQLEHAYLSAARKTTKLGDWPKVGLLLWGRHTYYEEMIGDVSAVLEAEEFRLKAEVESAGKDDKARLEEELNTVRRELEQLKTMASDLEKNRGLFKTLMDFPPGALKIYRDKFVQRTGIVVGGAQIVNGILTFALGTAMTVAAPVTGGILGFLALGPSLATSWADGKDAKNDRKKNSAGKEGHFNRIIDLVENLLDTDDPGPVEGIVHSYVATRAMLAHQSKQGLTQALIKHLKALGTGTVGAAGSVSASVTILTFLGAGTLTAATGGLAAIAVAPLATVLLVYYSSLGGRAVQRKIWGGKLKNYELVGSEVSNAVGFPGLRQLCLGQPVPIDHSDLRDLVMLDVPVPGQDKKPVPVSEDKKVMKALEKRLVESRLRANPYARIAWMEHDLRLHALTGNPGELSEAGQVLEFMGFTRDRIEEMVSAYKAKSSLAEASLFVKNILAKDLYGIKYYGDDHLPARREGKLPGEVAEKVGKWLKTVARQQTELAADQKERYRKQLLADDQETLRKAAEQGATQEEIEKLKKGLQSDTDRKVKEKSREWVEYGARLDRCLLSMKTFTWTTFAKRLGDDREVFISMLKQLREDLWRDHQIGTADLEHLFEDLVMEMPLVKLNDKGHRTVIDTPYRVSAELVQAILYLDQMLAPVPPAVRPLRKAGRMPLGLADLKGAIKEIGKEERLHGTENKHVQRMHELRGNWTSNAGRALERIRKADSKFPEKIMKKLEEKLRKGRDGQFLVPPEFKGDVNAFFCGVFLRDEVVATKALELLDPDQKSAKYTIDKFRDLREIAIIMRKYVETQRVQQIEVAPGVFEVPKDEDLPVGSGSDEASSTKSGGTSGPIPLPLNMRRTDSSQSRAQRRLSLSLSEVGKQSSVTFIKKRMKQGKTSLKMVETSGLPPGVTKRDLDQFKVLDATWVQYTLHSEPGVIYKYNTVTGEKPVGRKAAAESSAEAVGAARKRPTRSQSGAAARRRLRASGILPDTQPPTGGKSPDVVPADAGAQPVVFPGESLSKFASLSQVTWRAWTWMRRLPVSQRREVYAFEPGSRKNEVNVWLTGDPDGVYRVFDLETGELTTVTAEARVRRADTEIRQPFLGAPEYIAVERKPEDVTRDLEELRREFSRPRPGADQPCLGELLEAPGAVEKLKVLEALSEHVKDPDRVDWSTARRSGDEVMFTLKSGGPPMKVNVVTGEIGDVPAVPTRSTQVAKPLPKFRAKPRAVESLSGFANLPGVTWSLWTALRQLPSGVDRREIYAFELVPNEDKAHVWFMGDPDGVYRVLDLATGDLKEVTPESRVDRTAPEILQLLKGPLVKFEPQDAATQVKELRQASSRPRPLPDQLSLGQLLDTPEAMEKLKMLDALSKYINDPDDVDWSTAILSRNEMTFAFKSGDQAPVKVNLDTGDIVDAPREFSRMKPARPVANPVVRSLSSGRRPRDARLSLSRRLPQPIPVGSQDEAGGQDLSPGDASPASGGTSSVRTSRTGGMRKSVQIPAPVTVSGTPRTPLKPATLALEQDRGSPGMRDLLRYLPDDRVGDKSRIDKVKLIHPGGFEKIQYHIKGDPESTYYVFNPSTGHVMKRSVAPAQARADQPVLPARLASPKQSFAPKTSGSTEDQPRSPTKARTTPQQVGDPGLSTVGAAGLQGPDPAALRNPFGRPGGGSSEASLEETRDAQVRMQRAQRERDEAKRQKHLEKRASGPAHRGVVVSSRNTQGKKEGDKEKKL